MLTKYSKWTFSRPIHRFYDIPWTAKSWKVQPVSAETMFFTPFSGTDRHAPRTGNFSKVHSRRNCNSTPNFFIYRATWWTYAHFSNFVFTFDLRSFGFHLNFTRCNFWNFPKKPLRGRQVLRTRLKFVFSVEFYPMSSEDLKFEVERPRTCRLTLPDAADILP